MNQSEFGNPNAREKHIISCPSETNTDCANRQECFAESVGMPEYCKGKWEYVFTEGENSENG